MLHNPKEVAVETRAFSAAKITDRRNKLSMEMIECLECLKSWLSKDECALDQELSVSQGEIT